MLTLTPRRPIIPSHKGDAMKFSELAAKVEKALLLREASPLTIAQYQVCYGQFRAYLERERLTDDARHFTADTVQGFALYLKATGVTGNTVRSKLSALSTLARTAMTQTDGRGKPLLTADPTKTFTWPKLKRAESKFLYPPEFKAFREAAAQRAINERAAADLFLDTGARVSSLCRANREDVQEVGGAHLLRLVVKGGRVEMVPISRAAASLLNDSLIARNFPDPGEPLLVDGHGQRWRRTALSELMVRIGKAAGVTRFRVSAHKLRHTNNVVGRLAALDESTRAQLLSHQGTATLKVYDHLIPGELIRAREIQRRGFDAYGDLDVMAGDSVPTPPPPEATA